MTPEEARKLGREQAESEIDEGATMPLPSTKPLLPDASHDAWVAFDNAYRSTWFHHLITQ